jgi:hypothetical protein
VKEQRTIIFVPGKNPKPPPELHREQLLRCLIAGVERIDPITARDIAEHPDVFRLAAWNHVYYHDELPDIPDPEWIDALIAKPGPSEEDRRELTSPKRRAVRWAYRFVDSFPKVLSLFPDSQLRNTVEEVDRYFENDEGIAKQVRAIVKDDLHEKFDTGSRVMLMAHSLGSVIAYDALWQLTHVNKKPDWVDVFISMGSPLGSRYVQRRLCGADARGTRRYPHNIHHWHNVSAIGDLTAADPHLSNDFKPMVKLGLLKELKDIHDAWNWYRNADGIYPHRCYGYMISPKVAQLVVDWWNR